MIVKTIFITFLIFIFIALLISAKYFYNSLYKELLPFNTKEMLPKANVLSTHLIYIIYSDSQNPYLTSIINRYLYEIYKLRICDDFVLISRFNCCQKIAYNDIEITEDIEGKNLLFTLKDKKCYVVCSKNTMDKISLKLKNI